MKKRLLILSVFFSVIFLIGHLIVFFVSVSNTEKTKLHIFADISECEKIVAELPEGAQFERYSTPVDDKYFGNLSYEKFFGGKYKSSKVEFEIFAYQFNTIADASKYFENATGRNTEKNIDNIRSMGSLGNYKIVFFAEKNAYSVQSKRRYCEEIERILSEHFMLTAEQIEMSEEWKTDNTGGKTGDGSGKTGDGSVS